MTEGVKVFLNTLGMSKYFDMFVAKGFDLESDLPYLTAYELKDVLMIACQRDRALLLAKAQIYKPSPEHAVYEWLRGHSLDYYFISFVQSELTDLQMITQLQLPDEDLYDELEIVLPGHRKRLERAVAKLKMEQMKPAKVETPVAYGWWGKPECLPQAKFDFLCVKAFLFSAKDPENRAAVDFMVDSGSDVSTVQESILEGLNLELIGPVYSCGVHGGNHCNLYKARLAVGEQEMEIEVMGSNYDSLGSRVVRHFRHVIDGYRHIWLPGNYQDPLPAVLPLPMPQTSSTSSNSVVPPTKALPVPVGCESAVDTLMTPNKAASLSPAASTIPEGELDEHSTAGHGFTTVHATHSSDSCVSEMGAKNSMSKGSNVFPSNAKAGNSAITTECEGVAVSPPTTGQLHEVNNTTLHSSPQQSESSLPPSSSSYSEPLYNFIPQSTHSGNESVQDVSKNLQSGSTSNAKTATCPKALPTLSEDFKESHAARDSLTLEVSHETVENKDCQVHQRVSLSHVIPPSLRDTDDDVDYHHTAQSLVHQDTCNGVDSSINFRNIRYKRHRTSSRKLRDSSNNNKCPSYSSFTGLSDVVSPKNTQSVSLTPAHASQTDKPSMSESNNSLDLSYSNNFVPANNKAVMLSEEDLESLGTSISQETKASESHSQYKFNDHGHHLLCEARPDNPCADPLHSPRKRFKHDSL